MVNLAYLFVDMVKTYFCCAKLHTTRACTYALLSAALLPALFATRQTVGFQDLAGTDEYYFKRTTARRDIHFS